MRRLLAVAIVALAAAPAASAARPQAAFGLRVVGPQPTGYFVYSNKPGTTRSGAVIVSNTGNATGTVRLETADATTGTTTGTVYLTDRAPHGAGAWISLAVHSLTLSPGAHAGVGFHVQVPAGAAPGEYVGGIVAAATRRQSRASGSGKTSVRIQIRNLSIMAVQVNVPGKPIHRFAIGPVVAGGTDGSQQVVVRVANQGNVLEKPSGSVTIEDRAGKKVETLDFQMDSFLPHTAIAYPVALTTPLQAGSYTAEVSLLYGAGARTTTQRSFDVSGQDVQKVVTTPAPTLSSAEPTGTVAAARPVGAVSSSSFPWLWVAVGVIVVAALLLAALVLTLLDRRRPVKVVTIPPPRPSGAVTQAPPPPPRVVEPAEPVEAAEPTEAAAPRDPCDPYHYWDVAYDEATQAEDGTWLFPHRCRNCGLELLARDVTHATEQAAQR